MYCILDPLFMLDFKIEKKKIFMTDKICNTIPKVWEDSLKEQSLLS